MGRIEKVEQLKYAKYSPKNLIPIENLNIKTKEKSIWFCEKGHEWEAETRKVITRNSNCPYCLNRKLWQGFNSFYDKRKDLVKYWAPKNNISPKNILYSTNKDILWKCPTCSYTWKQVLYQSARIKKDKFCPSCSHRVEHKYYNISNYCPELKNKLVNKADSEVDCRSRKEILWTCKNNHSYYRSPYNQIFRTKRCPYCSGSKVLSGYNDLETLFPEIAEEWSENNQTKPNEHRPQSRKIVEWKCKNNHYWKTYIYNRGKDSPSNCPKCSNKDSLGEQELCDYVQNFVTRKIIRNVRNIIAPYELDVYIPELNIAIEFNGVYWHSDEHIQKSKRMSAREYHEIKINRCREKGVDLLFVWEDDWKNKKEEVKTVLRDYFEHRVPSSLLERLE